MDTELTVLVLAGFLHFAQVGVQGYFKARAPGGNAYNMSPRDEERRPGREEGRATRALENLQANLLVFAIAVLAIVLTDHGGWWTGLLAWTWLGARILYVPAYVGGWVPWRSGIWALAALCQGLLLLAALV